MNNKAEEGISGSLERDLQLFRQKFDRCSDVVFRDFLIGGSHRGTLIYLDGMVDAHRLESAVLRELTERPLPTGPAIGAFLPEQWEAFLGGGVITAGQLRKLKLTEPAVEAVVSGETIILIDGVAEMFVVGLKKWEDRAVSEPASEPNIRGPRDGFTETLRTNTALVRRRIKTANLKMEALKIGRETRTDIVVAYMDNIARPDIVQEVHDRLNRMDIDGVLESSYIEEIIEDNSFTVFPLFMSTERPDRVAASLLEGKVAIMVDNTPFALLVPATFFDMIQAAEDYYQHYIVATATRWLRLWLSFSALVFPSLYIAVTTFHQEMIPSSLLLSIASSREAVPFPAIVEAFLMEGAFEGLREAGVRLPRPVGQAVSIVGALVIGQAAVQAGIVSASLVIVVSFTGIASFIFPSYSQGLAVRVLRFPLMILAGTFGLYGIFLGLLSILIHLAKLRSFGVPYLSPVAPLQPNELKDVMIRAPWWGMIRRPIQMVKRNRKRMSANMRPHPPKRGES